MKRYAPWRQAAREAGVLLGSLVIGLTVGLAVYLLWMRP